MKIKVINRIGQKVFNAAGCFPWVNKIVDFLYQRICLLSLSTEGHSGWRCFRGILSTWSKCCNSDFTQTTQNLLSPHHSELYHFHTCSKCLNEFSRLLTYFLFCSYLLQYASINTNSLGKAKCYSWPSEMHFNTKSKDNFITIEFKVLFSG